jgi:hypothetical protein
LNSTNRYRIIRGLPDGPSLSADSGVGDVGARQSIDVERVCCTRGRADQQKDGVIEFLGLQRALIVKMKSAVGAIVRPENVRRIGRQAVGTRRKADFNPILGGSTLILDRPNLIV